MGDLIGWRFFFLSVVQQPQSELGSLIADVSRSHTIRHTQYLVWPPWTSDLPVAETATYTTHNKHERRKSTSSVWFEPVIPATEGPQTYEFHRGATGSGIGWFTNMKWICFRYTYRIPEKYTFSSSLSLSVLSFYRCTFCLICFPSTSMTFHLL